MAATQQLQSPPGLALTTALATVYTNPANSGVREIVQVTFPNVNGTADAFVSSCVWIDVSAASASLAILPANTKVERSNSVTVTKVLDPGDSIRANASAANYLVAIPEIIGREAA